MRKRSVETALNSTFSTQEAGSRPKLPIPEPFLEDRGLAEQFIDIIPKSMWTIRHHFRDFARDEFSVPQFRVMARIFRAQGGSITTSEIADHMGISVPSVSRLIDTLVRRKIVVRGNRGNDRRCVSLQLTELGKRKFHLIRNSTRDRVNDRFSQLSAEERNTLNEGLKILGQVIQRLE